MSDVINIVSVRNRVERNLGIIRTNAVALAFMLENDEPIETLMEVKTCIDSEFLPWFNRMLMLDDSAFIEVQHKLNGRLNHLGLSLACVKGYIRNGDEHELHREANEANASLVEIIKETLAAIDPSRSVPGVVVSTVAPRHAELSGII